MADKHVHADYSPNRGTNHLDVLAEENDAAQATVYLMRDWRKS